MDRKPSKLNFQAQEFTPVNPAVQLYNSSQGKFTESTMVQGKLNVQAREFVSFASPYSECQNAYQNPYRTPTLSSRRQQSPPPTSFTMYPSVDSPFHRTWRGMAPETPLSFSPGVCSNNRAGPSSRPEDCPVAPRRQTRSRRSPPACSDPPVGIGGIVDGDNTTLTKVFVGGLAWTTTSQSLHDHFSQYGAIREAAVIYDKDNNSKGFGFVTFVDSVAAGEATSEASPMIDGRRTNCNLAVIGQIGHKLSGKVRAGSGARGGQHCNGNGVPSMRGFSTSPPPRRNGCATPNSRFPAGPGSDRQRYCARDRRGPYENPTGDAVTPQRVHQDSNENTSQYYSPYSEYSELQQCSPREIIAAMECQRREDRRRGRVPNCEKWKPSTPIFPPLEEPAYDEPRGIRCNGPTMAKPARPILLDSRPKITNRPHNVHVTPRAHRDEPATRLSGCSGQHSMQSLNFNSPPRFRSDGVRTPPSYGQNGPAAYTPRHNGHNKSQHIELCTPGTPPSRSDASPRNGRFCQATACSGPEDYEASSRSNYDDNEIVSGQVEVLSNGSAEECTSFDGKPLNDGEFIKQIFADEFFYKFLYAVSAQMNSEDPVAFPADPATKMQNNTKFEELLQSPAEARHVNSPASRIPTTPPPGTYPRSQRDPLDIKSLCSEEEEEKYLPVPEHMLKDFELNMPEAMLMRLFRETTKELEAEENLPEQDLQHSHIGQDHHSRHSRDKSDNLPSLADLPLFLRRHNSDHLPPLPAHMSCKNAKTSSHGPLNTIELEETNEDDLKPLPAHMSPRRQDASHTSEKRCSEPHRCRGSPIPRIGGQAVRPPALRIRSPVPSGTSSRSQGSPIHNKIPRKPAGLCSQMPRSPNHTTEFQDSPAAMMPRSPNAAEFQGSPQRSLPRSPAAEFQGSPVAAARSPNRAAEFQGSPVPAAISRSPSARCQTPIVQRSEVSSGSLPQSVARSPTRPQARKRTPPGLPARTASSERLPNRTKAVSPNRTKAVSSNRTKAVSRPLPFSADRRRNIWQPNPVHWTRENAAQGHVRDL